MQHGQLIATFLTDKHICRFFGAPVCRVFPDLLRWHIPGFRTFSPRAARALLAAERFVERRWTSMPFFRGRGQDHEAAGLSASESDESDLEVCHAHHAPTPPHAHRVRAPPSPAHPNLSGAYRCRRRCASFRGGGCMFRTRRPAASGGNSRRAVAPVNPSRLTTRARRPFASRVEWQGRIQSRPAARAGRARTPSLRRPRPLCVPCGAKARRSRLRHGRQRRLLAWRARQRRAERGPRVERGPGRPRPAAPPPGAPRPRVPLL